jgi:hypothetical protein
LQVNLGECIGILVLFTVVNALVLVVVALYQNKK